MVILSAGERSSGAKSCLRKHSNDDCDGRDDSDNTSDDISDENHK